LSTKFLDKNIISFYFYFVCALLVYIFFLKNKESKDIYKRQKQIYSKDKEYCIK